ncbi:elongation factor P hydroxylase [Kangiella japonica]|uniref:Elongation factor P hydroxylase n=1 Tax=Kangiella japonica TaxID=647384 RepID=A0ABP3CT34_9GAMM
MLYENSHKQSKDLSSEFCVQQLAQAFNECFAEHKVILKPGATEPFYQAADSGDGFATIHSTHDYFSSALHEIAHWCIAGEERRKLDDYGYWYAPDGRTAEQQALFYKVEVKPQALEWAFSLSAGVSFRLSLDNLNADAEALGDANAFGCDVYNQLKRYFEDGFPARATAMIQLLCKLYRSHQPIQLPTLSISQLTS